MRHSTNKAWKIIVIMFLSVNFIQIPTFNTIAFNDHLEFEQITSLEGLSHDTVYSITQDKLGFLWFGTEDGLNKYDGYHIEVYRGGQTSSSIGNANCSVIYVDENNNLWIASWGGGIQVLNPTTGLVKSYVHNDEDSSSISDNSVHSIYQDKSGTFWFGTYTKGLNKFDKKTETFKSFLHDDNTNSISDNRVWWISETQDGKLLLATNKGLDLFDPLTETFTHFNTIQNRVRTLYWDKDGVLWLGTQKGLCSLDPVTSETQCYYHTNGQSTEDVITSIYEDSVGNFWVGSSGGLNIFDKKTGLFTLMVHDDNDDGSIGNNDVRVIFEDQSGNLWVGTRGGGVSKINIKPRKFESYRSTSNVWYTLSDANIFSMMEDSQGVIWLGTNNGGLNKIDLQLKTQTYLLSDITKEENRDLSAIVEDGNSIWVGSLGGLNKINKVTNEWITYKNDEREDSLSHNTVLSVLKDHDGQLWVGTLQGLNLYDAQNDRFIRYYSDPKNKETLSSDTINVLFEDHEGNLWIGTNSGLNKMNRLNGKVTRYLYQTSGDNSISDNIIHSITEDADHHLWIGTQYGLNQFDIETGLFKLYTTEDGLPNNTIRSIQVDSSGLLWISTNKGISTLNVDRTIFTNYDLLDGMQGNGYNNNASTITKNGILLFGGPNGFDVIDPSKVSKSTYLPPMVITGFKVMNQTIDYRNELFNQGKISLNYKQKNIHVEFASLDYTIPNRNQYAYKLEGVDQDWILIGSRNFLDYSNLPIGNYTLKIKGTNSDGIWNEEGLSISLIISPPWWLTTGAYAIYIFIGFIILFMIFKLISDRKEERNLKLTKMLNESINVLSRIGEMRDVYTAGHQRRVQQLSCAIASEMGLSQDRITNINFGSLIHDIGKIMIPADYLNKPGKLSELEFTILQTHVTQGHEIIEDINFPIEVSDIVCQHHERLDGSGYPNKLVGDQIRLESRIVAVADSVEAMSSDRPYRAALGIDAALDEILRHKGTKFDADVVDTCVKLFKQKGFKFNQD